MANTLQNFPKRMKFEIEPNGDMEIMENPMKNVETKQLPTKMYYEDSAWSRDWRKWWHESCDELGLPYDTSFKDFTLALGKQLYPDGVSYPPNRAERRKSKRKKR